MVFMRVAISTTNGGLDDRVSDVFGRTMSFTIVDIENGEIRGVEVVKNEFAMRGGGAGIAVSQLLADKGVDVVVTGNVGPNAMSILSSAGIRVYRCSGLKVRDAIERLVRGELEEIRSPGRPMGRGRRWLG